MTLTTTAHLPSLALTNFEKCLKLSRQMSSCSNSKIKRLDYNLFNVFQVLDFGLNVFNVNSKDTKAVTRELLILLLLVPWLLIESEASSRGICQLNRKQLELLNLKFLQIPPTEHYLMILIMITSMLKSYGVCIWLMHTFPIIDVIQCQIFSKGCSRPVLQQQNSRWRKIRVDL